MQVPSSYYTTGNNARALPHVTKRLLDENSEACLAYDAQTEIAYLEKYGRPLPPFQRLQREIFDYKKQSPSEHSKTLPEYLKVVSHLVPLNDEVLLRPKIRHPDFRPSNVIVSDQLEISGLIDWQHCSILPIFLQSGIPHEFQNYGDEISESLTTSSLPEDFNSLDEQAQSQAVQLLQKRQVHYNYFKATARFNPDHYRTLINSINILRQKLYTFSSVPWEGNNVTLKAYLIELTRRWPRLFRSASSIDDNTVPPCPISFNDEEAAECLRLHEAVMEADEQYEACKDSINVGPESWVPADQYEETMKRAEKFKADALEEVDPETRAALAEHWIFDGSDDEEYT
ncbi:MAG: Phosphotransferase enzyme [Bogoriella megaspora]|nr:MAG: Phosphotransferase enzyme [Bogoriella megaspora]